MDTPTLKYCKYGQHEVPVTEFNKDNKAADGLQTHCKKCKKKIRAESVATKKAAGANYEGTKKCNKCGRTKPRTEFDIDWRNADCFMSTCKECDKARLQTRKKNLTPVVDPDLSGTKTCTNCTTEKSRTEFNKDAYRSDGLFPWCKSCSATNSRAHYEANTDLYIERATTWTKANRDVNNRSRAAWKKKNPEMEASWSAQRRHRISIKMTPRDTLMSANRRKRIKNNPCHYCGLFNEVMHTDHYIPLARGGTDHFWNLVRSCGPCNLSKGTMTGDEYIYKLMITPCNSISLDVRSTKLPQ